MDGWSVSMLEEVRFQIVRPIGKGGRASVYLARDPARGGAEVALKVIRGDAPPAGALARGGDRLPTPQALELRHEFEQAARLQHPNLVRVFEYGTAGGGALHYAVLEHVAGENLREFGRRATLDEIEQAIVCVLKGLAYLHRHGLLHRDIKPEHILVGEGASGLQAKLTDFGLVTPPPVPGSPSAGTLPYMAPEVLLGRTHDPRTDLYSLGVSWYEVVTGNLPFVGADDAEVVKRILEVHPAPVTLVRSDVPPAIEAVILRLLRKDPADRFPNAEAVMAEIYRARGVKVPEEPSETRIQALVSGRFVGRERETRVLDEVFRRVFQEPAAAGPWPQDSRTIDRRKAPERRRDAFAPAAPPAPAKDAARPAAAGSDNRRRGQDRRAGSDRRQLIGGATTRVPPPPRLVLVSGPKGIGKRRLVQELLVRAQVTDAGFYTAHLGRQATAVYGPLASVLERIALDLPRDAEAEGAALRERARALREADRDLNAPPPDGAPAFAMAVAEEVARAARRRPLAIALHDLHRASAETLLLVRELARAASFSVLPPGASAGSQGAAEPLPRLLVVATYRPGGARDPEVERSIAAIGREKTTLEIRLRPLGVDDVQEMVRTALGLDRVPRTFVRRVHETTGGVPGEIETLLATLIERDLIPENPAANLAPEVIDRLLDRAPPRGGADGPSPLVLARLEGLDPRERAILEVLSVSERPLGATDIAAILTADPAETHSALAGLVRRRLVRREDDGTYAVRQSSVAEAILIGVKDRSATHVLVARFLERARMKDPRAAVVEELVYHFAAGGDRERAMAYGLAAARKASRVGAHERAARYLEEVVRRLDETVALQPLRPTSHRMRRDLVAAWADALARSGRMREALACYDRLRLAAVEEMDPKGEARLLVTIGALQAKLGGSGDSRRHLARAVEMAERTGDPAELEAALVAYGEAALAAGDADEAIRALTRSIEIGGPATEPAGGRGDGARAQKRGRLAEAYVRKGLPEEALGHAEKARELARSAGALAVEGRALEIQADILFRLGKYDKAADATNAAAAVREAIGDRKGLAEDFASLADIRASQGDVEGAAAHVLDALLIARRLQEPSLLSQVLVRAGDLFGKLGDPKRALFALDEATTLAHTEGDIPGYARLLVRLGETYLQVPLAPWRKAWACFRAARRVGRVARASSNGAGGSGAPAPSTDAALRDAARAARVGQARVLLALGRPDRAVALLKGCAATKQPGGRARALAVRALAAAASGPVAKAMAWAERAVERANRAAADPEQAIALGVRSLELAHAGKSEEACRDADEALRRAAASRSVTVEREVARLVARACLALGDGAKALATLVRVHARDAEALILRGRAYVERASLAGRRRPAKPIGLTADLVRARKLFARALRCAEREGKKGLALWAKSGQAEVRLLSGKPREAGRLLLGIGAKSRDLEFRLRVEILTALARRQRGRVPAKLSPEARAYAKDRPLYRLEALLARGAVASEAGRARAKALARALAGAGGWRVRALREDAESAAMPRPKAQGAAGPGRSEPADGGLAHDRLLSLVRAVRESAAAGDLTKRLQAILDGAVKTFAAERGLVLLHEGATLVKRACVGPDEEMEFPASVARRVATTGEAVLAIDARSDLGGSMSHQSVRDLGVRSLLCVPLRVTDVPIGALYIDHRLEAGRFGYDDQTIISAYADLAATAIEAWRLREEEARAKGALEREACEVKRLAKKLRNQLRVRESEIVEIRERLLHSQQDLETKYRYDQIIGRSDPMRAVLQTLDKVTDSDVPVLVHGESGTGKELVARAIHFNGPRKEKRFVSINCAALSETLLEAELFGYVRGAFTGAERDKPGLFQEADGGTLFLDEIGDMPPSMQVKLLRVLQEGEVRPVGGRKEIKVSVRIVSASNKDLRALVEEGTFREDLFWRLNVVHVALPPLRERREDIPLLVRHFLERSQRSPDDIDPKALDTLSAYDWPGNIRELENEVKRLVALVPSKVGPQDISPAIRRRAAEVEPLVPADGDPGATLKDRIEHIERHLVEEALDRHGGNKTRTAKALGLSRFGFLKKLAKLGLS